MIAIYKITNPKEKIYIGQSINIKKRFLEYKALNCKFQRILYNSFLKYGVENHKFEVIEECNIDLLNERERYWQDFYNCVSKYGLNCRLTKTNDKSGIMSDESKLLMSKCRIGIKRNITDESRKKMSERVKGNKNPMFGNKKELNPFYGKKHSQETKLKISELKLGENNFFYGKKRPEHSAKMSGINHFNYGKKNDIISNINKQRVGLKNSLSKIILDLKSGIYYYSMNDYCNINKINISTFRYKIKNNLFTDLLLC